LTTIIIKGCRLQLIVYALATEINSPHCTDINSARTNSQTYYLNTIVNNGSVV